MSEALLPTVLPLALQPTTEVSTLPNDQSSDGDIQFHEFFTQFTDSITSSTDLSVGVVDIEKNFPNGTASLHSSESLGNDGIISTSNEAKSHASVSQLEIDQATDSDQGAEAVGTFKPTSQSTAMIETAAISHFDKGTKNFTHSMKNAPSNHPRADSGNVNNNALISIRSSSQAKEVSDLAEIRSSFETKNRLSVEHATNLENAPNLDKNDVKTHVPFAIEGSGQSKYTKIGFQADNTKHARTGSKLPTGKLEAKAATDITGRPVTPEAVMPTSQTSGQKVSSGGAAPVSVTTATNQDLITSGVNDQALTAKISNTAENRSPFVLSHPQTDESLLDVRQRKTVSASNHSPRLHSPLVDPPSKAQAVEMSFAKSSVSTQSAPDKLTAVFTDVDFGPVQSAQTATNSQNVSPSPAPTPTSPQQIIAQQLNASLPRNNDGLIVTPSSTEFALDPPELGRIRIVVTDSPQGPVISITAERSETMDLMRRHADLLRDEFMQDGLGDTNLQFSNQNGSESAGEQDYIDQSREPEEVDGPRTITTQSVGIAIGALDLRL